MNAMKLKNHIQSLLMGERPKLTKSQLKIRDDEEGTGSDGERRSRPTTPGRALLEEVSLKPVGERNIKGRLDPPAAEEKCEFKNHFKDFMKTPASVRRGRSFSQTRDKDKGSGTESLSRKESFERKCVEDSLETEKYELKNHTQRFLKRKSMINPTKTSDESDNDSLAKDKPVERDNRDGSPSDVDDSPSHIVVSKPPPFKTAAEIKAYRRTRKRLVEQGEPTEKPTRRFDRRIRSKSDITVPKFSDLMQDLDAAEQKQEPTVDLARNDYGEQQQQQQQSEDEVESISNEMTCVTVKDMKQKGDKSEETPPKDSEAGPRVRKNTVLQGNVNIEYVSTYMRVSNAMPRPFVGSPVNERERPSVVPFLQSNSQPDEYGAEEEEDEQEEVEEEEEVSGDERVSPVPHVLSQPESRVSSTASSDSGLSVSTRTSSELASSSSSGREATSSSDTTSHCSAPVSKDAVYSCHTQYASTKASVSPYSSQKTSSPTISNHHVSKAEPKLSNTSSKINHTAPTTDRYNSMSIDGIVSGPSSVVRNINDATTRVQRENNYVYDTSRKASSSGTTSLASQSEPSSRKTSSNNYVFTTDSNSRKFSSNSYGGTNSESGSRKNSCNTEPNQSPKTSTGSLHTSTSDIMNACKSGLRRLTYRKTYSKSRVTTTPPDNDSNHHQDSNNKSSGDKSKLSSERPKTTYTQHSSGSRLPNRPTTPGPYLSDRNLTAGLYSPVKRPTTPGPFSRDSWKRTNQKFNYARILGSSSHETFI